MRERRHEVFEKLSLRETWDGEFREAYALSHFFFFFFFRAGIFAPRALMPNGTRYKMGIWRNRHRQCARCNTASRKARIEEQGQMCLWRWQLLKQRRCSRTQKQGYFSRSWQCAVVFGMKQPMLNRDGYGHCSCRQRARICLHLLTNVRDCGGAAHELLACAAVVAELHMQPVVVVWPYFGAAVVVVVTRHRSRAHVICALREEMTVYFLGLLHLTSSRSPIARNIVPPPPQTCRCVGGA